MFSDPPQAQKMAQKQDNQDASADADSNKYVQRAQRGSLLESEASRDAAHCVVCSGHACWCQECKAGCCCSQAKAGTPIAAANVEERRKSRASKARCWRKMSAALCFLTRISHNQAEHDDFDNFKLQIIFLK